ncbi:iron-siderophore ABC transporter substrate-binding protein [Halomonas sp. YLB-10]|nr:iron-siderophore ABC transporter substrate-binding protein [Halomonas sp. YLB-10]
MRLSLNVRRALTVRPSLVSLASLRLRSGLFRSGGYHSLAWLALSAWLLTSPASATPRIASLDWTLAETLIALDAPPVALAQVDDYESWVGLEAPPGATDIGLRTQPNLELLSELDPDAIVISPMFANLAPRLSSIAEVKQLAMYSGEGTFWSQSLALTRHLGELVDRQNAAEALIEETEAYIADIAARLPEDTRPLLLLQFMDERHVRLFGEHSLYQAVLTRMGLTNAWQGTTNAWGFSLIGIEQLANYPEARIVVVEPYIAGVREALADSGLWRHLGSVQRDDVVTLPPVWSFGALPSARRFATLLGDALSSNMPDTRAPDTHTPDTSASDTSALDTSALDINEQATTPDQAQGNTDARR